MSAYVFVFVWQWRSLTLRSVSCCDFWLLTKIDFGDHVRNYSRNLTMLYYYETPETIYKLEAILIDACMVCGASQII